MFSHQGAPSAPALYNLSSRIIFILQLPASFPSLLTLPNGWYCGFDRAQVVAAGALSASGGAPMLQVSISGLKINGLPVGPSELSSDTATEATRYFRAPSPCDVANVTGMMAFTWLDSAMQLQPVAPPYLEIYLGQAQVGARTTYTCVHI
jgi:hypothetical protein